MSTEYSYVPSSLRTTSPTSESTRISSPSGSISADETLHASINDSNPNRPFYGISHIVFCSVKTNCT
ncbi:hypothetical protein ACIHEJ_25285 [Streptomyces sp. NPDC052301]|uniref:hypothetical protein n=1 Tax=Streptomyces sp. NPDC052301 TaxID=3365687 RepID=UPI0037D41D57